MTNKSQHTPSPWHRNVGTRYPIYAERTQGKKDWVYIANVCEGERYGIEGAEAMANLNLITAAPELLEALESVESFIYELIDEQKKLDGKGMSYGQAHLLDLCQNAIAKARGE